MALNAVSIAIIAALTAQVLHEACHAIAVVLVGARLKAYSPLFAVDHDWVGEVNTLGNLIIASNAALFNILTAIIAIMLFSRPLIMRRPMLRLFLLFFGAYSLFSGFGYLMVDPLFYQPGGENLGDWKQVVEFFGGGWAIRILISVVGAAGVLWGFFWLARSTLQFGEGMTEQTRRIRLVLPLLIVPYVVVNVIFTILSFWHPLGPDGVFITVLQFWFGYIGFFWAFFIASYWTEVNTAPPNITTLPAQIKWPWVISTVAILAVAIIVLLPTIYF